MIIAKAMIIQPTYGSSDQEIINNRNLVINHMNSLHDNVKYDVINTVFSRDLSTIEHIRKQGVEHFAIYYLGKFLEDLSKCSTICFCSGWENFKVFQIIHSIAIDHNLEVIYSDI